MDEGENGRALRICPWIITKLLGGVNYLMPFTKGPSLEKLNEIIKTMKVEAVVRQGHGVASGKAKDPRYPQGTLNAQCEYFLQKGLDLSQYFLGTINLDIAPNIFKIKKPKYFLENVNWSEYIPPENFYFFDVSLQFNDTTYKGMIYMPDPATKAEHFQNPTILELLLPRIDGLKYGDVVMVQVDENQIELIGNPKKTNHKS